MGKRSRHTAAQKVKLLREHLDNQVPLSELSERYGVHVNVLYKWKKELFEGALETFNRTHKKVSTKQDARTKALEEKLKKRDALIAELLEENIQLKKSFTGEV